MSDTPRTDAVIAQADACPETRVVFLIKSLANLAEQLERELASSEHDRAALHSACEGYRRIVDASTRTIESHGMNMPLELHPATKRLVLRFSQALAEKLHKAEQKYGYDDGWSGSAWEDECRARLHEHLAKGDPRDVANYCAFMWHHGWRTSVPSSIVTPAMDAEPPQDAEVGYYVEFNRGWWARCVGPNKDRKEKSQTTGRYAGNVTEAEAKELDRRVDDFLGRRGWPDGDAQVEIMRGGKDVKITVGGSTHVRSIREWHELAVQSFVRSATLPADRDALLRVLDAAMNLGWLSDEIKGQPGMSKLDAAISACSNDTLNAAKDTNYATRAPTDGTAKT